jgi:hypothetical protein
MTIHELVNKIRPEKIPAPGNASIFPPEQTDWWFDSRRELLIGINRVTGRYAMSCAKLDLMGDTKDEIPAEHLKTLLR